jgi:hypothetical protein
MGGNGVEKGARKRGRHNNTWWFRLVSWLRMAGCRVIVALAKSFGWHFQGKFNTFQNHTAQNLKGQLHFKYIGAV